MRTNDICMADQDRIYTRDFRADGMHMPGNKPFEKMTMEELKPALHYCNKSRGKTDACLVCPKPCKAGLRAIELEERERKEP